MPEANAATESPPPPAPAPPPLLTRESFAGLLAIVEDLLAVGHMLNEGRRIPVEPQLEQQLEAVVRTLVTVSNRHPQLSVEALHAWAARASALGVLCTDLTVKLLADLTDRELAKETTIVAPNGEAASAAAAAQSQLVGPDLRPVRSAPPTLPPHLQAVIAAHHAPPPAPPALREIAELHTFSIGKMPNGFHRVVCHTCSKCLGEVRDLEIAERIAMTHSRSGAPVVWIHPLANAPLGGPYDVPTCKRCGCTEHNACIRLAAIAESGDGAAPTEPETCSWHELNTETNAGVCTACKE